MSDPVTTSRAAATEAASDDPFERMRVIGEEIKAKAATEEERVRQLREDYPSPPEHLIAARRGMNDFVHAAGPAGVSVNEVVEHWGITREQADEIYEMSKAGPSGGNQWLPLVARDGRWYHYEHLDD